MSFLAIPYPYHVFQFASDMIAKGAVKVDKSANNKYAVTIHDPCNLARVSSADVLRAVRDVVRHSCNDVREMPSSIAGANTICCGGGGGLIADETRALRMQAALPRCVAAKKVGSNFIAAPCEICKEQLTEAMDHWQIRVKTGGVMELLGRAMLGARGVEPFRHPGWRLPMPPERPIASDPVSACLYRPDRSRVLGSSGRMASVHQCPCYKPPLRCTYLIYRDHACVGRGLPGHPADVSTVLGARGLAPRSPSRGARECFRARPASSRLRRRQGGMNP